SDVFMAKISARAKRPPMSPNVAVRQLYQENPTDPLTMAMVKKLGPYPPGSLVQLGTGEVAVSIRLAAVGPHPLVATLSDRNGRPCAETHRRDTALPEFKIQGPPKELEHYTRVLPERVYGILAG
ncbi:MAG TPA: phosphohydrolase, partial [Rhizobacter sp.]|nr:phosphohydrolase [Rhizobacter sp.]